MKPFYGNHAARAKYYALRRWTRVTSATSIACLLIIGLLYFPEYLLHEQLVSQHKELYALASPSTAKPVDMSTMQLALSKIQARQQKANGPTTLLKKIKTFCKDDSSLESLSLKHHNLQITLAAKNASTLVTIADSLSQHPACADLHISSLEPKEQRMIAILKSQQEFTNS